MKVRINSLDSRICPNSYAYLDCSSDAIREVTRRAINIDMDLTFESFECKIKYEGQKTSLTLLVPKFLKTVASPRTVTLLYGRDSFFPAKSIVFRPYNLEMKSLEDQQ